MLSEWWIKNYHEDRPKDMDIKILTLNDEDFVDFVSGIKDVDALQNLCSFLKGALDERREQYLDILIKVKHAIQGFIKEIKFYTDEDGDCLLPTDEIIRLIKKWFADVVEERNEQVLEEVKNS